MRNYISLKRKYIIPFIIEISIKYNLKLFLFLISYKTAQQIFLLSISLKFFQKKRFPNIFKNF